MIRSTNDVKLWTILLIISLNRCVIVSADDICGGTFGGKTYDLSELKKWNPWNVTVERKGVLLNYQISICDSLKGLDHDPCKGASVCVTSGDNRTALATYDPKLRGSGFAQFDHFWLELKGAACTDPNARHSNIDVKINMQCGSHLSNPILLTEYPCGYSFLWTTLAACVQQPKPNSQVPCTAYDESGRFYDLTPLSSTPIQVTTQDSNKKFFIRVCSKISIGCPNSSACLKIGESFYNVGNLNGPLRRVNNRLELTYESPKDGVLPDDCNETAKTTVVFVCPSRDKGKDPQLIFEGNCLYQIYWETEYACPQSILNGNFSTCSFDLYQHGVQIDLNSLRKKSGEDLYNVSAVIDGKPKSFRLNICGGLLHHATCNGSVWNTNSVCLHSDEEEESLIGSTINAQLRYLDGEATLTYFGSGCDIEGENQWKTVIKFVCDKDKTNGEIEFIGHENCTFLFKMLTKTACVKERTIECALENGPLKVKLDPLKRKDSERTWMGIDAVSQSGQSRQIFFELCGGIGLLGAPKRCPSNSSICMIVNGSAISLGSSNVDRMSQITQQNSTLNSYVVEYVNGDSCGNGTAKQSRIEMLCSPGIYTSSPILIGEKECTYDFVWHTASACQQSAFHFEHCKFEDKQNEITIDLNPLRSASSYLIETDTHSYYINVCGPVIGTPCNQLGMEKARGCQTEKNTEPGKTRAWNLGETPQAFVFDDGELINMTYTGGSPYRDANKTPRSMSMTFLCDPNAGNGKPELVGEENRAYGFLWRTSLVCSVKKTGEVCVATDTNKNLQYDLSSLTRSLDSEDWSFLSWDGKRKFYINVCANLNKPGKCGNQSAACVADIKPNQEEVNFTNLGQALQRPIITNSGRLQLQYTLGDKCNSYGQEQRIRATINFICSNTQNIGETQGPRLLSVAGNCNYSFLWATEAACAIGKEEFHNCKYTDPINGQTYDLNPLRNETGFYQVHTKNQTFQLNICGSVGTTGCPLNKESELISACELDTSGNTKQVLGFTDSGMITAFEGQPTRLTYIGAHDTIKKPSIQMDFGCDRRAIKPIVTFVRGDSMANYYFHIRTVLVCAMRQYYNHCSSISGPNFKQYNLNKLNGKDDFKIEDRTAKINYVVSLCGGVTGVGGVLCHDAGGCKFDLKNQLSGVSLGVQKQPPKVLSDGTILIQLVDGSPCNGTDFKNTASITLSCYPVEKALVLESVSSQCEHIFKLRTPAACPAQQITGNRCVIEDKAKTNLYDLNKLTNNSANYKAISSNNTYEFNICGQITNPVKGCEDAGACLINGTEGISFGKPSRYIIFDSDNHAIHLIYDNGAPCLNGSYKSLSMTFICDPSGPKSEPIVIEETECTVSMLVPTDLMCHGYEEQVCSVTDRTNGFYYDLSDLSLPDRNYIVGHPTVNNIKFVINVCRTLVVGNERLYCPLNGYSCIIIYNENGTISESTSLAKSGNPLSIENGVLKLEYTNGDYQCDGKKSSTVIEFRCQQEALFSEPQFISQSECAVTFIWFTNRACPVGITEKVSLGNCTIKDPITGHLFDFSSLRNDNGHSVSSIDHNYIINICGGLRNTPCGTGSILGVCQYETKGEKRTFSGGSFNRNIHYRGGELFLNYSDGSPCHKEKYQRNTLIQFICDLSDRGPVFVSESSDCTYLFNWNTKLACQGSYIDYKEMGVDIKELTTIEPAKLDCQVKTKNGIVDLSPLTKKNNYNYLAFGPDMDGIITLDICMKIMSSFMKFPKNAAAGCTRCRGRDGPQSLGSYNKDPYVDDQDRIVLDYTDGSPCPNNSLKNLSSQIFFHCAQTMASIEALGFVGDGCTMAFSFDTYVVCPPKIETCEIGSPRIGFHLNLTNFMTKIYNVTGQDGPTTLISLCSAVSKSGACNGSAVCVINGTNKESYGDAFTSTAYHNGGHVTYTFSTKESCSDSGVKSTKGTEIMFHCNQKSGLGRPELYKRSNCSLTFLWESAEFCLPIQPPVCALWTSEDQFYDLRVLSSISHSWSTTDSRGNIYWLNLCREVHGRTVAFTNNSCPPYAGVCYIANGTNEGVSLGNVRTQRLRIDEKSKNLILSYDLGDSSVCANQEGQNLFEKEKPSTEIVFKCGNKFGSPQFISGPTPNDCTFKFEWQTHIACPEMGDIEVMEKKGIIIDSRLKEPNFFFNLSSILNNIFYVKEIERNENYTYVIDLGEGVKHNVTDPECSNAIVCQMKENGSFYRDLGSLGSRKFHIRGEELRLKLTSYGRKCGKNKSKNVTTVINFQCASYAGLGEPKFLYESGDCDYLFEWETAAVCPVMSSTFMLFNDAIDSSQTTPSALSLSAAAIMGIIIAIVLTLSLISIVISKKRRTAVKAKVKSCFQKVHLPKYQQMKCYFQRLGTGRGSQLSASDGEAVLLSPDEPFPRFHDDSDTEPIA